MNNNFSYHYGRGMAQPPLYPGFPATQPSSQLTPHDLYRMIQRLNERLKVVEERISRLENRICTMDGSVSLGGETEGF